MATNQSVRLDLLSLRDRYLRELVDMARDKDVAQQKLTDIFALERAIALVQPQVHPQKYGGFKRAKDAILDYLDEVGHAVDKNALADAVVERGFRAPNPGARAIVLKSIASYTDGVAGRKVQVVRQIGTMIGRGEWPDAMFK